MHIKRVQMRVKTCSSAVACILTMTHICENIPVLSI